MRIHVINPLGTKSLQLQNLPENRPAFKFSSVLKYSSGSCLYIHEYTEIKNCEQLIRLFFFFFYGVSLTINTYIGLKL